MNTGKDLFHLLQSFKQDDGSGKTSQDRLFDYCVQILGAVERFHVDFKEKRDRNDAKLSDDDKKNLAKAVSGFANSGGGVLIWGIENNSISPKPITDIQYFVSSLLKLAPQATDPTVPDIDGDWIPSNLGKGSDGFGIIYIPESPLPPHRVLLKYEGIKDHYFIRSGESFIVASHVLLEDMFGRRPRPNLDFVANLVHGGGIGASIIVGIKNSGRGIAKFPFLSIEVAQPYTIWEYGLDGNGHTGLPVLVQHVRTGYKESFGGSSSIVVYPDSELDVTAIKFHRQYSIAREAVPPDLVIKYSICCEGVPMQRGDTCISGKLIKETWLPKQG